MIVPWTLLLTVLPYCWLQTPIFPPGWEAFSRHLTLLPVLPSDACLDALAAALWPRVCVSPLLCWARWACGHSGQVPRARLVPGSRIPCAESPLAAPGAFGGRGESRGLRGCSRAWAPSALRYRVLGFIAAGRIVPTSGTALRSAPTWIKPLGVTASRDSRGAWEQPRAGPRHAASLFSAELWGTPGAGPGPAPHWMNSCQNTWEMQFGLAQNSNHLSASSVSISALRSI